MSASVKTDPSRWSPPRPKVSRLGILVVVLGAIAVAAFGVVRLVDAWTAPPQATPDGSLGGLHTEIRKAAWVNMADMAKGMAPGMPMNQMANMPEEGDGRVEVKVTVSNTTERSRLFIAAEEFVLRAEKGDKRWQPVADTFGDLPRLPSGNAVNGTLFFDMPPDELKDTKVWLEWNRDGESAALRVPLTGEGGGMDHPDGDHSGGK